MPHISIVHGTGGPLIDIWVASAAELRHQGFSVLFGRDLLAGSTLHYDGKNGLFTLTF